MTQEGGEDTHGFYDTILNNAPWGRRINKKKNQNKKSGVVANTRQAKHQATSAIGMVKEAAFILVGPTDKYTAAQRTQTCSAARNTHRAQCLSHRVTP